MARIIHRSTCSQPHRRGVALVVVLSSLVLLSGLIIAFFLSVSTERLSAKTFADSFDARKLADTTLSVVVAQIKDATNTGTAAWASQPGLIRTFDATGNQAEAYKLYSAASLRGGSAFKPGEDDAVPSDWYNSPALYTDLNAPVYVPDVSGTITIGDQSYSANYPILDASVLDLPSASQIKGFSVDSAPVNTGTANANRIPMPVQWLYVLQDGQIVSASAGGNSSTVVLSGSGASTKNPIVGRIAFWTDDETCKVNINTAAGDVWDNTTDPGAYSDMPYFKSGTDNVFENSIRVNQPIQHEYQRYPGHPATTFLSAVFPGTLTSRPAIYDIVPRVSYYKIGDTSKKDISSQGGTVLTSTTGWKTGALPLSDGDHLYASVDELQFVTTQASLSGSSRPANIFTPEQIRQAKFFLTAQSRAPDVNLFGKPRISMWPEIVDTNGTLVGSAFDKTIAFCATIGSGSSSSSAKPYYFVRNDATSATYDYSHFSRNQSLYTYLQNLTEQAVPGFGGKFSSKYGDDRDQILTELFDYIRGSINLLDVSSGASSTPYAGTYSAASASQTKYMPAGTGQVVPIEIGSTRGFGRVYVPEAPILHLVGLEAVMDGTDTVATGSTALSKSLYINKVQAAFLLANFNPALGVVRTIPDLVYEVKGLDTFTLGGYNLGFPSTCSTTYCSPTGSGEYCWGAFSSPSCLFWKDPYNQKALGTGADDYQFIGGIIQLPEKTYKFRQPMQLTGGKVTLNIYARDKLHQKINTPIQTLTFRFPDTWVPTPGVIGSIYPKAYTYDWTLNNIPATTGTARTYASGRSFDDWGLINPGYNIGNNRYKLITEVARGLVPYHGDMRLVVASKNVDADVSGSSVFTPGLGYMKAAADINQNIWTSYDALKLENSSGGMISGPSPRSSTNSGQHSTSGILVPEVTYDQHANRESNNAPAVSSLITAANLTGSDGKPHPGDWDTGMAVVPDGPYINKADEGDVGPGAYSSWEDKAANATLFSPNRQVPSPVIFGSLSSGVKAAKPWQTLLFCPNPPAKEQHPGFASPPDHLLLDLFSMPVVEPYAISEPFSTAGRINMNYQIAPFTYIKRNTGLQAVLRSTRLIAVPTTDGLLYKYTAPSKNYRPLINIDGTLKAFDARFSANKPFRSASEICDMFLVPEGVDVSGGDVASIMSTWWDDYKLTGDNLREKPYAQIYSRLTTKSNSYTVHVRVQALKKRSTDPNQNQWVEGRDTIIGEYRGSFGLERFIDPNDDTLSAFDETEFGAPNYDSTGKVVKSGQIDPFYRFRVTSTKQFAP